MSQQPPERPSAPPISARAHARHDGRYVRVLPHPRGLRRYSHERGPRRVRRRLLRQDVRGGAPRVRRGDTEGVRLSYRALLHGRTPRALPRAPRGAQDAHARRTRRVPLLRGELVPVQRPGARAGHRRRRTDSLRQRNLQLRHLARRSADRLRHRLPRRGDDTQIRRRRLRPHHRRVAVDHRRGGHARRRTQPEGPILPRAHFRNLTHRRHTPGAHTPRERGAHGQQETHGAAPTRILRLCGVSPPGSRRVRPESVYRGIPSILKYPITTQIPSY